MIFGILVCGYDQITHIQVTLHDKSCISLLQFFFVEHCIEYDRRYVDVKDNVQAFKEKLISSKLEFPNV